MTWHSSNPYEIVYVWPYLEWGGAQTYFLGLMKYARREYRVSAAFPAGTSATLLGYLDEVGVSYHCINQRIDAARAQGVAERVMRRWRVWRTQIAVMRTLARHDAARSLFHCDLAPWMCFPALAYLAIRSRVVVTLHTALPRVGLLRRWSWWLKFSVLCALPGFQLLASNRDMLRSLRPYLRSSALGRVRIAPTAIDAEEIDAAVSATRERDPRFERLGLPRDRFYVVSVGQFIERKGRWILLDAARRLCDRWPDMVFLWLSPVPLGPGDRARVETFGLGDRFRCLTAEEFGPTRHDYLTLVREADVFVLPSLEEGLPLALLEAMALGVPVVASRINAVPEAVDHGVHGLLIDPGDADALVEAIARLRNDSTLRAELADRARRRVLDLFELAAATRPTLAAYASAWP